MKVYTVDEVSCEVNEVEVATSARSPENTDIVVLRACLIHATLTARTWSPNDIEGNVLAEPDFGYEIQVISHGHTIEVRGLWGRDKRFALFYGTSAEELAEERRKEYAREYDEEGY